MNKEDKELLLKDLCARLPYGVKVRVHDIECGDFDSYLDSISINCVEACPVKELTMDFNPYVFYKLHEIKPYLRPMSSMTEEEKKEYNKIMFQSERYKDDYAADVDWLNAHHFDYRGLIDKGLALEAPKDMYKF